MMEGFENSHKPFDLLPDEMVVNTLSFIDADTLLNCRLVCKRWLELIDDAYVFQEKASRENEFVNNGRGYYSFSQIDSNTVRKLDLPWYVFYVICKYDPFNRNLVKNHCGQDGYKHWSVPKKNKWTIEQTPQDAPLLPSDPDFDGHTSCFVSTSQICEKSQRIIFKNHGLNDTVMATLQPEISVSEWYNGCFDCGCRYVLRATVFYENGPLLEQHNYSDFLPEWGDNLWKKASHSFKNTSFVSYLDLYHSGVDTEGYRGHYGTKITGSVVKVLLPIKFKSAAEHRRIQNSSADRALQ